MTALGDAAQWLAYAGFAVLSVVLAVLDVRTHRLPHVVVLPAYAVAWLLLGVAAAVRGDGAGYLRAVLGMLALFAFYAVLRAAQPGGMGGGDVTLAGLLGFLLAYLGWDPLLLGAVAGFVLGGLYSLVVLLTRRGGRRTAVAFGPWMLLGAWVAIVAHALPG